MRTRRISIEPDRSHGFEPRPARLRARVRVQALQAGYQRDRETTSIQACQILHHVRMVNNVYQVSKASHGFQIAIEWYG